MGKFIAENVVEVNGVSLHYAVMGEGRPVVLVHGNGDATDGCASCFPAWCKKQDGPDSA